MKKGFTLVELLLYMGIFSILLLVLMQLFTGILSTHAESQASSGITQDGNFLLSRLSYDIRRADSIDFPTSFGVPASKLSLTVGGTQYTYQYDSTTKTLSLTTGGATYPLTSYTAYLKQASDAQFTLYGNGGAGNLPTVQIILTLTSTTTRTGVGNPTKTFETTVGTRGI